MMMKRILWWFGLLILPLMAQQELTLSESWQIALQNNLTLQQQQKVIEQASREWQIQKSQLVPTLSASGNYNYVSELARLQLPFPVPGVKEIEAGVRNQYDLSLVFQQPIFTGFRTINMIKSARQQYRAQQLQKRVIRNQLLFQIGQLFYSIQLNLLQQQVLRESIARTDNHLQQVRNFYLTGQAPAFDTLQVFTRKLQEENRLEQVQNTLIILTSQFRHLLNVEQPVKAAPLSIETVNPSLAPLDEYLNRALQHRPELQQFRAVQEGQRFRKNALRSAYYPQVIATATYHYARPGVDFFRGEWMDYYTVGVGLKWNLWNWKRDQRRVEQVQVEMQRLDLKTRQLSQDIRQQVIEAYQHLKNTARQIQLQRQLAAQEQERYRIVREQYTQGQASNLDLDNAETALTEAELGLKQAYIQWYRYSLQLDFATGEIYEEMEK